MKRTHTSGIARFLPFLFLICWFGYLISHLSVFQVDEIIRETIAPQDAVKAERGYLEFPGDFQARRNRIKNIEIYLNKHVVVEKAEIALLDEAEKEIAVYQIPGKQKKIGKLVWKGNQWLKKKHTYKVKVRLWVTESVGFKQIRINYNLFLKEDYAVVLLLAVMTGVLFAYHIRKWRRKNTETEKSATKKEEEKVTLWTFVCIGLQALVSFYLMEFITQGALPVTMPVYYQFHNWLLCFAFFFILLFFTNSAKAASIIGNLFFLVWAIVSNYVYLFKGQILQPIDLKSIGTAFDVAGNYDYRLTPEMAVAISVVAFFLLFFIHQKKGRKIIIHQERRKEIGKRAGLFGSGIIMAGLLWYLIVYSGYISSLNMHLNWFNSKNISAQYGTVLTFAGYLNRMKVDKPERYQIQAIEQLEKQYETNKNEKTAKSATAESGIKESGVKRPNIIVIMNESFADLSYAGEIKTNQPYLENYNSIKENTIKGNSLVSVFGGGTPNSEFEFLTGHSLGYLPGTKPFAQFITEPHDNMVRNLKSQGYTTTAIHLKEEKNWRRDVVYPYLGFDRFISIEDVELKPEDKLRYYASDEASYRYIYKELEEKEEGKPAFIFNVTIQNHGNYSYEKGDFQDDVWVEGYDSKEVNQYLSLIKRSDVALGELIQKLKEYEEPVLLVFFGDHYPNFSDQFYEMVQEGKDTSKLAESQKLYTVPFLIWANFGIQEQENIFTSLNYLGAMVLQTAGVELSPYDNYRLALQESIPAMNVNGYLDAEGNWYRYSEKTRWTELLNQYWSLEYNELFDKRNKLESFFQVE